MVTKIHDYNARFHQRRSTLISVQLTLHLFPILRKRKKRSKLNRD